MSLAPEDRQRIIEEERIRAEARQRFAAQGKIKRKSEFLGVGALIQALALFSIIPAMLSGGGAIIGLSFSFIMFLVGSHMAVTYICTNCGNKVANKGINICSSCQANLTSDSWLR